MPRQRRTAPQPPQGPQQPQTRRPRRPPGRRGLVSAGHILGAGLICFASWLIFDGVQLKSNALGSPVGLRRTVSIDALTPFAFVSSKLGIDRVARGFDDVLGRSPGGTPAVVENRPAPPAGHNSVEARDQVFGPPAGLLSPDRSGTTGSSTGQSVATTSPSAITQPTAGSPVTVLVVGDSLGEDLGIGLGDVVGSTRAVHLVDDATGETGLSNVAYFDWPAHLAADLAKYHPKIVVAMFGGNDWQSILVSKYTPVNPGTPQWKAVYRSRVKQIVDETSNAGAQIYWVGLPPMGPASNLPPTMAPSLNAIYRAVMAQRPGAVFVPTAALFEHDGAYAQYLPNPSGGLEQVRDADGIHLDPPAGCDIVGHAAVRAIETTNHISI